jgi:hypothetical protein
MQYPYGLFSLLHFDVVCWVRLLFSQYFEFSLILIYLVVLQRVSCAPLLHKKMCQTQKIQKCTVLSTISFDLLISRYQNIKSIIYNIFWSLNFEISTWYQNSSIFFPTLAPIKIYLIVQSKICFYFVLMSIILSAIILIHFCLFLHFNWYFYYYIFY